MRDSGRRWLRVGVWKAPGARTFAGVLPSSDRAGREALRRSLSQLLKIRVGQDPFVAFDGILTTSLLAAGAQLS